MLLCPSDGRPCCDDLCRGGGCIMLDGEPMFELCSTCGGSVNATLDGTCDCDDDEYPEPGDPHE